MIRRLYRIYRPHLGWLLLGTLLALITLLANVGLLALSGWFITSMAVAGATGATINYFTPAAIIRGLAMVRTAGRYGERVVTHEATFRLIADLRSWFYRRIEPLAPAALSRYRSGELLNHLQKDIDRLDAVYLRIAMPIIVAAISVVLFTLFAAAYDLHVALLNLGFLLAGGIALPLWIERMSRASGREQVVLTAGLRTECVDTVQGMAELIACDADTRYTQRFHHANDTLLKQQHRYQGFQSLAEASQGLLAQLAVWCVLLIGIPLVQGAQLTPPSLAMLALFTLASFETIMPLPAAFGLLGETGEAARRIFGVAETTPVVSEPEHPRLPAERGDLRFDGVSLSYTEQNHALQGITFALPAGSRTLLLGPSGSGKTSIVNLLLRFWDPGAGSILFDGIDLREFNSEHWRSRVTLVSQHTQLIAGTVRENLCLAAPAANDAELLSACKQAQILDFVESLPQGLDTWLGETGSKLSGGQARRIAIARALLKPGPLLILDEPTEGLDRRTEREVLHSLESLMQGRTVLLITHRDLHLRGIDQTLTLDQGKLQQAQTAPGSRT